jgi:hypothetical protein
MRRLETIHTEPGAHTIGFHSGRHTLYAFLPATHRASIFQEGPAVRGS